MTALKELTGQQFGKLEVVEIAGRDPQGRATWLCQCECGSDPKVIPSRHLVFGQVVSCGCHKILVAPSNGRKGAPKISGALSPHYKLSLTEDERMHGRNLVEVRDWRRAVFERDDYTCDLCGMRGLKIVAHHLNCWADYPDQRLDIDNGITLCKVHHKSFHTSMGGERKHCNRADYGTFKGLVCGS